MQSLPFFQTDLNTPDISIRVNDRIHVYIFGEVFYVKRSQSEIIKLTAENRSTVLLKHFSVNDPISEIKNIEGQFNGYIYDNEMSSITIFSDLYGHYDLFYNYNKGVFICSDNLNFLFNHKISNEYNQLILGWMLSVYGWYAPKGFTIYKNIKRLRIGEYITIYQDKMVSKFINKKLNVIENYDNSKLEYYRNILDVSIKTRIQNKRIIVASSGGWDSTIIACLLKREIGEENVKLVRQQIITSERSIIFDDFANKKVEKISEYLNIELISSKLDFRDRNTIENILDKMTYLKSKHVYAFLNNNFMQFSSTIAQTYGSENIIMNGELCDSYHNFGFSQFKIIKDNNKYLSEYVDKMSSYLFGPTFFKKIFKTFDFQEDNAFLILKSLLKIKDHSSLDNLTKKELLIRYSLSILTGTPRIAFNIIANPLFRSDFTSVVKDFIFENYIKQYESIVSERNIYSYLFKLYQSFHAQSSTINMHKQALKINSNTTVFPFADSRMIDFLSKMPEDWGRGLNFYSTKYPLKEVANSNSKIVPKNVFQLLSEDPHYLVSKNLLSPQLEILYYSGFKEYFKYLLLTTNFKHILDDSYFDLNYIKKIIVKYSKNEKLNPIDEQNLISLLTLQMTGYY